MGSPTLPVAKSLSEREWQYFGVAAGVGIAAFIILVALGAYSDDVNGRFQRDVNGHSGDVNKVGAQRRWDYNHARYLRD